MNLYLVLPCLNEEMRSLVFLGNHVLSFIALNTIQEEEQQQKEAITLFKVRLSS